MMPFDVSNVGHVCMADIVGNYDTPDQVPEWTWVENNASYSHSDNGNAGVWEFILNLSNTFDDIPRKLLPVILAARMANVAYLVFHQGT